MVRLLDIAREAGVSVMTVSRVLSDSPAISTATKTRVRAIAERLGYVPDVMARSLRTQSTLLLGAVVTSLTDPVFGPALRAVEEQAQEKGYDLLVAQSQGDVGREDACIRRMLGRRVEGLFLGPAGRLTPSAPVYEDLRRRGSRVVLLGAEPAFARGFIHVGVDEAAGSHALTRHLLSLGHRRIAFFAGPVAWAGSQARFEGYRRALREAGLDIDDRLVFRAGIEAADGARTLARLWQERTEATAIQAVNDLVAAGVVAELRQRGCRVPEDVSVVGFGDLILPELAPVPLTTVWQPKHRLGEAAMELMAAWLRGQVPVSRLLAADLVVRASAAAPPSALTASAPAAATQRELSTASAGVRQMA
jgi:LacI family transcriptional regulator